MAMIENGVCGCGKRFAVYVPKAIYAELDHKTPAEIANAQEIDVREVRDGEVESAQLVANIFGAEFVDGRQTTVCPKCGVELVRTKERTEAEKGGEALLKEALRIADARNGDDLPF